MMSMVSLEQRRALSRERNSRWREKHAERKREQSNAWYAKQRAARLLAKSLEPPRTSKVCPTCKVEKTFADFGVARKNKDGNHSYCSVCARARSAAWYASRDETTRAKIRQQGRASRAARMAINPERVLAASRASQKRRRERCPDVLRANQKRWREENLERLKPIEAASRLRNAVGQKALAKKWREAHPERKRELNRKWHTANLSTVRLQKRATENTRRAKKAGVFIDRIDAAVVFDRDGGVCGICRTTVDRESRWHVDHVMPISKGGEHSYANVQLAHARCNISKGNRIVAA